MEKRYKISVDQYPDILFHRFFQSSQISPKDRLLFKGKQNLDVLESSSRSLLIKIQDVLNDSLRDIVNTFAKGKCRKFHFDYIEDTGIPNAMAFEYEGYAFIGITMNLIQKLWQNSNDLSQSKGAATILQNTISKQQQELILIELFSIQISFIVLHEFAHHDLGHSALRNMASDFWNEIIPENENCTLENQAREINADAWATYLVLDHLMRSERRKNALINLWYKNTKDSDSADVILLSLYMISITAFFLIREEGFCDEITVYKISHPPQAVRINEIMRNVQSWCQQNRPTLEKRLTLKRFQEVTFFVKNALNKSGWKQQTTFLKTPNGGDYITQLQEQVITQSSCL